MLAGVAVVLLCASAQPPVLRGIVSAEDGGVPLAGAVVEIVGSGERTWSDSAGFYTLALRAPGTYHLRVARLGYVARALEVVMGDGTRLAVDIVLASQPQPLARVAVVASAPRVSTGGRSSPGFELGARTLDGEALRAAPAFAEPDALRALTTGAHVATLPDAPTSLHVRGGAADQNRVLLDGVPIYNPYHAAGTLTALDPDVVGAVTLHAGVPSARYGGALSSVITIGTDTVRPSRPTVRGGIGASGIREAVAVPLPWDGASLLVAGRRSIGELYTAAQGATTSGATFSDVFGKATLPLAGGTLGLFSLRGDDRLAFDARTEEPAASVETVLGPGTSNQFGWSTRTYAAVWNRGAVGSLDAPRAVVRGWLTSFDASAAWARTAGPAFLTSSRSSLGLSAEGTGTLRGAELSAGAEVERLRDSYRVADDLPTRSDSGRRAFALGGASPELSIFAEARWRWADRWALTAGARAPFGCPGSCGPEPRLALRFQPSDDLALSVGYARMHQLTQSLRNDESPIDGIVGIALPLSAQAGGPPVARADQITAAVETRLPRDVDVTLDGYVRRLDGLLLVAPSTAQPFAIGEVAWGTGAASGVGLSVVRHGVRSTTTAAYTVATTTRAAGPLEYRPAYGATQALTLATAFRLAPATTARAALWGQTGRAATLSVGPFEWSPAPLVNGAGDVAGSPQQFGGPLGGTTLPAYWRLDAGLRHAWRPSWLGAAGSLTGSLTVTNLLNRANAYRAIQASSGAPPYALRLPPRALVLGLEWSH
jgi:hypothetical protein